MPIPKEIIDKIVSGRFLLTIIAGAVFAYCAITKIMPIDKVTEIVLIVIYAYFTRADRKPENGGSK